MIWWPGQVERSWHPRAARPRPGSRLLIPSSTVWSDAAVRQRGSSPGFLPAYSSRFKSPGQHWLPIPTPAGLSFWGAGIVSTVYLACCKSSRSRDMHPGAAWVFFSSLSLLCFLLVVFVLKCVKWRVPLPPLSLSTPRTNLQLINRWNSCCCARGERVNLCLHVCMCKIETKMSMNSRKSSGRPSYYYRLLRRSRLQRQRSRSRSRNRPLSRGNCNNSSL